MRNDSVLGHTGKKHHGAAHHHLNGKAVRSEGHLISSSVVATVLQASVYFVNATGRLNMN